MMVLNQDILFRLDSAALLLHFRPGLFGRPRHRDVQAVLYFAGAEQLRVSEARQVDYKSLPLHPRLPPRDKFRQHQLELVQVDARVNRDFALLLEAVLAEVQGIVPDHGLLAVRLLSCPSHADPAAIARAAVLLLRSPAMRG